MLIQNNPRHSIQCSPHSCNLHQHIWTSATFLYHRLNSSDVSLNSRQPIDNTPQRVFIMNVVMCRLSLAMIMMLGVAVIHILTQGSFVFPRHVKGFVNQWLSSNYGVGTFLSFFLSRS